MHPRCRFYINLVVIVLWIVASSLPPATSQAEPFSQPDFQPVAGTYAADIRGFHLVSADEGWLLLGADLYWTKDGGGNWQKITPPAAGQASIQAVAFLDNQLGWAALVGEDSQGFPTYQLAQTADGGASWRMIPLSLFAPGDVAALAAAVYLDFIDPATGWMMVKQATGSSFSLGTLFKTMDGGLTWTRLSAPSGDAVYFVTGEVGWVAGGPAGDELFRTMDGGLTWSPQSVTGQADGRHLYQLPDFKDSQEGILPVVTNAAGGSQIDFFSTSDGGQTWVPTASAVLEHPLVPGTHPALSMLGGSDWVLIDPGQSEVVGSAKGVQSTAAGASGPLPSGIAELDMATHRAGWAWYAAGDCQPPSDAAGGSQADISCTSGSGLLRTGDGGQSWTLLALPQSGIALTSASNPQVVTGQGFDSCYQPSLSQMQTWMDHSPYRLWNLYIGGASVGSFCGTLTAAYVSQLTQQGWKFIATWVGPQAACWPSGPRMSSDPATAYTQGISEADLAIAAAANLLLTLPDKTGAIIYYDLEAYNVSNSQCRAAAQSFISGWTTELHAKGNQAGVYGSGYSSALSDFASNPQVPDGIWAASWTEDQFDCDASVWDIPHLANTLWTNHQRLHQYAGGHNETWGGVTINIDSTVADGLALDLGGGPAAQMISPVDNSWLPSNSITVTVVPVDPSAVISRVDFEWHSSDWKGSSWVLLGSDRNGSDGWSISFDPSSYSQQQGAALYAYVYGPSGKRSGVGVWNLGIDHTPPTITSLTTAPMYALQGGAPFRDFHVRFTGSDSLSGVASYDVQYRESLNGPWTDMVTNYTGTDYRFPGVFGNTYYFRARARDNVGNVGTYTTSDVHYLDPVQTCTPPVTADDYEPDNSPAEASLIPTDGSLQYHNFDTEGDQDWVKFIATAYTPYTLKTSNVGGFADTVLYLYGPDGIQLLNFNDDYPGLNLASRIDWESTAGGTYYLKVVHYDIYAAGCTTQYGLSVTQTNNYRWFIPFVLVN